MTITPVFALAAIVAVLVVFGPGLLPAYAVGLRGLPAWACAPAVTTAVVGLGGIATPLLHLRWSPAALVGWTALLTSIAWGTGRLLRWRAVRPVTRDSPGHRRAAAVGVAIGAVSVLTAMVRSMRQLTAVPAQPDVNYHLNQIRHMLIEGDISSMHAGGFVAGVRDGFYPATFHGLAVSVAQIVSVQPIVVANLVSLVIGSLVWVSGCVLLARQTFGRSPAIVVFAGVASATFTAMPYWLAGYGTLWPNLTGMSVIPVLVAAMLSVLGLARDDALGPARGWAVGLTVLSGLTFAHPNSVAAVGLIGYVLLCVVAVRRIVAVRVSMTDVRASIHHLVGVALPVVAMVGVPLLWWQAQGIPRIAAVAAQSVGKPEESLGQATIESLLSSQRFGAPLWATSVFVIIGLVALFLRSGLRWVPVLYLATSAVFIAVAAVQSDVTRTITGFWYNNSPRLAAIVPVAGVLLVTEALRLTAGLVQKVVARQSKAGWAGIAPGVALAAYLVLTLGNNVGVHVARMQPFYYPHDASRALLPDQDVPALVDLARSIPPDAITIGNPWRGMSLLYAFTGRRVLFPTEKSVITPDQYVIASELSNAADSRRPQVCEAIVATGATYVITGGTNFLPNTGHRPQFHGVDTVADRAGFVEVATSGPYTLWRIDACS